LSDQLEKQLIFLHSTHVKKSFFEHSSPYLEQLIDYYLLCLSNFSPLLPDWLSSILEGDVKGLEEKMRQAFSDSFGEYQHEDIRWILNKNHLPSSSVIIDQWQNKAQELTQDVINHWYPN
jgi:exodeoxyribonuclease V gamma subunit